MKNNTALSEEIAIELLGGEIKSYKVGSTKVTKLNSEENIICHFSRLYDDGIGYWFGLTPSVMSKYKENKIDSLGFVLGFEGVVKLPLGLIYEYVQNADVSHKPDGIIISRYHIRFKMIDDLYLYNSKKVFNVSSYMINAENIYRDSDKKDKNDKEDLKKRAGEFVDFDEQYSGEATVKRRKESRLQKQRIAKIENYTCQVCGFRYEFLNKKGKKLYILHVDHITDKSKGGGETMDNLWVLCPNCHTKKTYGAITIDKKNKVVKEKNKVIAIRDNHLGW